jgi:hypothetical protein
MGACATLGAGCVEEQPRSTVAAKSEQDMIFMSTAVAFSQLEGQVFARGLGFG